ncbi:hypothetical protein IGI04_002914 [Brassica rapa subsp. trilocularis]|uniref:Uncharacterized protein n=1 Tax=Brassica rapa subsp. trilocularis TaxID=1813537 RepID=A0ABQ7NWW3_BRACM|nr:hypothetical protein IGI04_002914 [Brassica rapa subsp. trilocularis]
MLLRLKSARVDYEKNLKPCNKKLVVHQSLICCNFKEEDEKFDKSVPEVNGGDYNEDGREVPSHKLMSRFVSYIPSMISFGVEPKVIVATSINPKFVGGRLLLNTTSGTHFYFDKDKRNLGVGDVICSTSSTKYEGVKKIEVVTVFELNAYVVNSTPHVTEFCAPEKCDLTSVGVVRYRVELCILDGTESAVFVVFYAKISWLTNVRAAEISELMGVGVGDCRGRGSTISAKYCWQNVHFPVGAN